MANKQITLGLQEINGKLMITGLLPKSMAAELIVCSPNKVKSMALDGQIRYVWIRYSKTMDMMMLYRVDVMKIRKRKLKEKEIELNQLKEGK